MVDSPIGSKEVVNQRTQIALVICELLHIYLKEEAKVEEQASAALKECGPRRPKEDKEQY